LHREEGLDFSKVVTFNLDEYVGLPPSHNQSYQYFMYENLFKHINIDPIGDKESRGGDFLYRRRTKPRVCVGMVRGLQMGIQLWKGKQSTTAVRVDAWEEGEGTAPVEGVEWEVGL
jgi:hypothetical protein